MVATVISWVSYRLLVCSTFLVGGIITWCTLGSIWLVVLVELLVIVFLITSTSFVVLK